jgi:hypothetical protein
VRHFLPTTGPALVALTACLLCTAHGAAQPEPADLILHNAKVTTLSDAQPEAQALAVRGEQVVAAGTEADVMQLRGDKTRVIDAGGRRVIPGLNDSHLHATREGRFYNAELRWDGVASLAAGWRWCAEQAGAHARGAVGAGRRRVVAAPVRRAADAHRGRAERAAPDTPTFVMFLYSQGLLNRAGVAALKITPETKAPPAAGTSYSQEAGRSCTPSQPGDPLPDDRRAAEALGRRRAELDAALVPRAEPPRADQRRRPGRRAGTCFPPTTRPPTRWRRRAAPAPHLAVPLRPAAGEELAAYERWTSSRSSRSTWPRRA